MPYVFVVATLTAPPPHTHTLTQVEDPSALIISPDSDDAPPYAGLPKTPRPLQNENFMGDVVTVKVRQNQPFKFVFKRKIYLKNLDQPSTDPMFERLVYLQAVDEIMAGNIPVESEDEVAKLTAQAMGVDLGDDMPDTEDVSCCVSLHHRARHRERPPHTRVLISFYCPQDLVGADLLEYVPKPWRDNLEPHVSGKAARGSASRVPLALQRANGMEGGGGGAVAAYRAWAAGMCARVRVSAAATAIPRRVDINTRCRRRGRLLVHKGGGGDPLRRVRPGVKHARHRSFAAAAC